MEEHEGLESAKEVRHLEEFEEEEVCQKTITRHHQKHFPVKIAHIKLEQEAAHPHRAEERNLNEVYDSDRLQESTPLQEPLNTILIYHEELPRQEDGLRVQERQRPIQRDDKAQQDTIPTMQMIQIQFSCGISTRDAIIHHHILV